MKIYLNKNAINVLNHNEFIAYVSLKKYIDSYMKTSKDAEDIIIPVNIDILIYTLFNSFDIPRKQKENFIIGFNGLIEKEVIFVEESNGKNHIIDCINMMITGDDKYFIVADDEVNRILSVDVKDRFMFFHYALTVLSTIWTTKKYGCNTIDDLAYKCEIHKSTALSYNELLERYHILYIKRNPYASRNEDGTIIQQANTYGRFSDINAVDSASEDYNSKVYDNTKKIDSNEKRSIKAYYKSFINGTYKGSIRELYDKVIMYNQDPCIKNKKELDISVFPSETMIEEVKEIQVKPKKKVKVNNIFAERKSSPFPPKDDSCYQSDNRSHFTFVGNPFD